MEMFKETLDNAPIAETLAIEVSPLENYQYLFEQMFEADANDYENVIKKLMTPSELNEYCPTLQYYMANCGSCMKTLHQLILDVFEIGYSYGEHDALANDYTLAEIEITD